MTLGIIYTTRGRRAGLSQGGCGCKAGSQRQTISKWELDETLPDIRQAKRLAVLYHLSLDELIDFDIDVKENRTGNRKHKRGDPEENRLDESLEQKISGSRRLRQTVDVEKYGRELQKLLGSSK